MADHNRSYEPLTSENAALVLIDLWFPKIPSAAF